MPPRPPPRSSAGDFVAIPRLNGTRTGDTLAPKGQPVTVPPPHLPAPALQVAVKPATRADDDKLMSALQRLCDEDPALTVTRDDETHQTILGVSGEVHLAVTLERLERKCNVHVEREELRIPYRETITTAAQAEGKHKKQSGGHGQFGVCHLRLEPLPRGEGFAFHDEVVGGAIPRQYIPAVEKGVIETMSSGGVFGYPVVDIAVTVDDGKAHSVDSNEVSFKMAAALAVRQAMSEAGPILLEPISKVEVTDPRRQPRRRARRPPLPPGAHRRHRPGRGRLPDRDRLRPDGRAHPLRRRPACPHRWTGLLHRGVRPLRRRARPLVASIATGTGDPERRGHASVSFCHATCSVSGMTHVPAMVVMKLVSPDQRGSTCRWTWDGMPAPAARPRLAPMFNPSGS